MHGQIRWLIFWLILMPLLVVLGCAEARAEDLARCETSIRGETLGFVYDPETPALQESRSLREWLYGAKGKITCPGLVTLRVLTPELNDTDRDPFCLQWDRAARTYIGYAEGERDAWLTCKQPSRSFCERVNRSKAAAARLTGQAADFALNAGMRALVHPSGAVVLQGPAAVIGGKLAELGAVALSGVSAPVALGTVAVTAVAVGGAVYVCSESGAEAAALDAAPAAEVEGGAAVTGVPVE